MHMVIALLAPCRRHTSSSRPADLLGNRAAAVLPRRRACGRRTASTSTSRTPTATAAGDEGASVTVVAIRRGRWPPRPAAGAAPSVQSTRVFRPMATTDSRHRAVRHRKTSNCADRTACAPDPRHWQRHAEEVSCRRPKPASRLSRTLRHRARPAADGCHGCAPRDSSRRPSGSRTRRGWSDGAGRRCQPRVSTTRICDCSSRRGSRDR